MSGFFYLYVVCLTLPPLVLTCLCVGEVDEVSLFLSDEAVCFGVDGRRTSDDDWETTGYSSVIIDCVLLLAMYVGEWGGVLYWGKECKDVSSPCNCSEAKELAKSLALSITFVVSSSSLSIYRKDYIDSEKHILYFC